MRDVEIIPGRLAYSYIRMSTDQQLKGDSLRRQAELSRQWAERHGLILDDSLRDIGVSAYKGKNRSHGALGRFIDMVAKDRIKPGSYLLVESLDRLSRDQVLEALSLFLEIIRAGVTIVTLADDQIYSQESVGNDWSKLIISLTIMARAHEESQRKSERVSQSYKARLARAAEGELNMSCRVPYWLDAKRLNRDRIEFTPNHHSATIVRMYELAAGGLSRHSIAKVFNTEQVPTLREGDHGWNAAVVNRIIDGRESLGEYQAQRRVEGKRILVGEPITSYFPAVVDEALWMRARSTKRQRNVDAGRKGLGFTNLFVGMGRCAHCGGGMTVHRSTQSRSRTSAKDRAYSRSYISCDGRRRGKVCPGPARSFRYDAIEETILDHVHEFMLSDIMRIRNEASPENLIEQEIATLTSALESITRRETNLLNQLEHADEVLPTVMARLKERQIEKSNATEKLKALERSRIEAELSLVDTVSEDEIKALREKWRQAEPSEAYILRSQAHTALRSFIDFIQFDGNDNTFTVIMLNGARAYKFREGSLIQKVDLVPQIGPRSEGGIDPLVFVTDGRTADPDPQRVTALNQLRGQPS